ncbi:MAG: glycosyltransferase family 2 protein [Bacteroidota bacterium]
MTPTVAIGLPVYNGERYLEQTLRSLLAQTFEDFVLVVVDNASTDATEELVLAAMRRDERVRYVRNDENVGASKNHNRAFAACRRFDAPYFRWAAYDDLLHPTYLEETVTALKASPEAVLVHPAVRLIDDTGAGLPYDAPRGGYALPGGGIWPYRLSDTDALSAPDPVVRYAASLGSGPAVYVTHGLIRTDALKQTSGYLLHGVEDVLMAELALRGPFVRLSAPLFEMRMHPGSTHHMSREEYLVYEGGAVVSKDIASYRRAFNFLRALQQSPLSAPQKRRAFAAWLRFAVRPQQLYRLLVPGPNNYFGINFSRATPSNEFLRITK